MKKQGFTVSLYDYCLENGRSELLAQWNDEKNEKLTPEDVPPHGNRRVWWRCGKGHEWQSQIAARVSGSGCPYCSGKRAQAGVNDLQSTHPELARQWIREKNLPMVPSQTSCYSNKSVWWRGSCGHEWQAKVSSRANGSGCPYCSGKKVLAGFNDLATLHPAVAAEWHPTLNGELTPQSVTGGSAKQVWWRCSCGHEWKTPVYSRTGAKKHGCPYCSEKLKGRKKLSLV